MFALLVVIVLFLALMYWSLKGVDEWRAPETSNEPWSRLFAWFIQGTALLVWIIGSAWIAVTMAQYVHGLLIFLVQA